MSDLKITTDRPLFHNDNQVGNFQQYSNTIGGGLLTKNTKNVQSAAKKAAPKPKKQIGKKIFGAVKDSGILKSVADTLLGPKANNDSTAMPMPDNQPVQQSHSVKKGMSTGAKIGIAAAVVAVIAGIIIMVEKNKKGGAK